MTARQDRAKRISRKFKCLKIWWLNQRRVVMSIGPVMLILLMLLLVARSFITVNRREHGFMPSICDLLAILTPGTHASLETPMPARAGHEREQESMTPDSVSLGSPPPTGCLAMIIKNEGPILPRLFESVSGFVSEYCVVDTGSTDDTIEVLESMNMPGVVLKEPFVDFATTRNYMIDACRRVMTSCDYLVLLDADMVLRVSPDWNWANLDRRDVYNLVQISGVEYENVRMIRRDASDIQVVGATHEYYDVPAQYTRGTLPKKLIYIEDVGDGKAKGDKFERDERLLRRELEKDPDNIRTVFYLANTLKDQGKYAEAIPYYERRATMGGWFKEADYSHFMLSSCYLATMELDNARKYGEIAAFGGMAKRAEPLYFLAFHLRKHGQYKTAWHYATLAAKIPKPDVSTALFVQYTIYDFWVDYELAMLSRHVFPSQPLVGMRTALAFWNNAHAPEDLRESFAPLMKAHVRPNVASGSYEMYRYRTEGTEMPLAMFPVKGHVHLLLPKATEGADCLMNFEFFDVDLQNKSASEQGFLTWRMDPLPKHVLGNIAWQFVGSKFVFGFPVSGSHVYYGEWNEHSGGDPMIHLGLLSVNGRVTRQERPLNLVEKAGTVYCITKWYPVIEVGTLKISSSREAICETYTSHFDVPRTFSFLSAATRGLAYREDFWFLLRVDVLNAFVMVVLCPDFSLKAFTPPFTIEADLTMEANGLKVNEKALGFQILTRDDGQDHVVFVYTSGDYVVINQISVEEVLAWMI